MERPKSKIEPKIIAEYRFSSHRRKLDHSNHVSAVKADNQGILYTLKKADNIENYVVKTPIVKMNLEGTAEVKQEILEIEAEKCPDNKNVNAQSDNKNSIEDFLKSPKREFIDDTDPVNTDVGVLHEEVDLGISVIDSKNVDILVVHSKRMDNTTELIGNGSETNVSCMESPLQEFGYKHKNIHINSDAMLSKFELKLSEEKNTDQKKEDQNNQRKLVTERVSERALSTWMLNPVVMLTPLVKTNSTNESVCVKCNLKFKCKEVLVQHLSNCYRPISCNNRSTLYEKKSLNDLKYFTTEKPYACSICDYKCFLRYMLLRHSRIHTEEKPYACSDCEYTCRDKSSLKKHSRTHTGEKPFTCSECDYTCSQRRNLLRHNIRVHTGEKPYACSVCDYRCSVKSSLKNHIKTHTGEKPYACNNCNYTCSIKSSLIKHTRIHTGEKPYECNECDFKCSLRRTLKNHFRIHTGEQPYACTECEFRCSQKCNLKIHSRTHTGEKPYTCVYCDYKCSQSGHLKIHKRMHTGEKPYVCNICKQSFAQKSHLRMHTSTHTGEKLYACNECDNTFSLRINLQKHSRTHTRIKLYDCDICDKKFSHKSSLQRHFNTHN